MSDELEWVRNLETREIGRVVGWSTDWPTRGTGVEVLVPRLDLETFEGLSGRHFTAGPTRYARVRWEAGSWTECAAPDPSELAAP